MSSKPLQIFGFIMSFAYVFFGLLFVLTAFAENMISDPTYRKLFGGSFTAYGIFRIAYFFRKLRQNQ